MSRFDILVAIRMEYKRVLSLCGDETRALAGANRVAVCHARGLHELNELRRAALRGCRYV